MDLLDTISKLAEFIKDKPFSLSKKNRIITQAYLLLESEGHNQKYIAKLNEKELIDRIEFIFHRYYERKFVNKLLRDDYKLKKSFTEELRKLLKIDSIYDLNKILLLINGYNFIEFMEKAFPLKQSLFFEIICNYFFYFISYKIGWGSSEIILKNLLPHHPTSQQHFFSILNDFIIKFAKEGEGYYNKREGKWQYDKRNEDSFIWADLISKLINPDTKKPFKFDSEFRK